jgi:redox-sensitive bicupin YhaK (pirin superfamily)
MQTAQISEKTNNIRIYPYANLGYANHGWLEARHHFSFASYYNPKRTGFGNLLVINDDAISAGRGFATHGHDNMEIITYVRSGAITHRDSMGNEGRTEAGDVQVMSAGTGVLHSEHNLENITTTLYQIWIKPNKMNVEPRWEAKQFPKVVGNDLTLLASNQKDSGAAFIYADGAIYGGRLQTGATLQHNLQYGNAYILVSNGAIEISGEQIKAGDGAEIVNLQQFEIKVLAEAELIVIDVANDD